MPQKVISGKTETSLEILKKADILKDFYLAGGTGLALQLNHRLSIDLDFFSLKEINIKNLIQKIKKLGRLSVEKESEGTLICRFNGTRLTFLKYEYPLLFNLKTIKGIKVASIQDIGCMKISAVSSRGTKKDFIDLYFICQKIVSFKKILELFKKKYKSVNYNMLHILKSLSYFMDAEKDPIPKMINQISWQEVKNFFKKEIMDNGIK
ncbi:MAG: nucleotidyl transferase AbiEii/AbiGii toxin family protein [Candidatus Nealsonbacteria bacterium]|nr:nucleotidyl transferase AbiEii/AbiGii toxin family protein [Candidatus Nealsonbacteria bacterium]